MERLHSAQAVQPPPGGLSSLREEQAAMVPYIPLVAERARTPTQALAWVQKPGGAPDLEPGPATPKLVMAKPAHAPA